MLKALINASLLPALLMLLVSASTACHWFQIKKNRRTPFQLILRSSVAFDRLISGETARVAFNTAKPANCEMAIWSQEKNGTPGQANPKIIPCVGGQPKQKFLETIGELSSETLYDVEIAAWPFNANKAAADRVRLSENDGKGIGKELVYVRLNTPLRTSEIHNYRSEENISIDALKDKLSMKAGCTQGVADDENPFSTAADLSLEEITSKGYGTSKSEKHQHHENRLKMYFNAFMNESSWQWKANSSGKEYEFLSRQGAEIFQVVLQTDNRVRIPNANLNGIDSTLTLSSGRPLTVSWSDDNQASIAHIVIQIGQKDQEGAFSCVFSAKQGQAVIAADQPPLNQLKSGFYDVTVTLYSTQIQIFPGTQKPSWVIASYDWRAARMRKI